MPDDIRQSLELNAKQVLDELERLKTSFTSYNDRLSTTANRLDSVTDSAKRTLTTLRDLRTEARLVERAMGSIGMGTKSLGSLTNGKGVTGIADASKTFDQFFVNAQRAQAVSRQTGESVSDAFERIHTATQSKFVPATKQVQKGTESMWLSWQTFARVVQTQLFVRGMNAVRDAFTESASAAMEFSSNVSNIRAINPERSFGEIAASVRVMSDEFNQSLETVSKAQLEVISDQFSETADMVKIMAAANKLAKATGEDLVPTAQLLTGALNAYGESAEMAEVRAAQFFKTVDLGRLKSGELATALGRVQSIGNSVGVEMEELDAALAAITIGGVKSNEAATQLRGILVGLLKPTEEMQRALAKLGFDSGEVAVKTLGLSGALEALVKTTDGSASSIASLFQNQRALAGALRLVNTGAEAYAESLDEIYAADQKLLASKLGERMQTDAERLTAATNQLKNFWTTEFGADVVEKLNTVIQLVGGGNGLVGAFRHITTTAPLAAAAIGGLTIATAKWGLAADVATAKFTNGVGLGLAKLGTLSNALATFAAYEVLSGAGNTIASKITSYWTGPIDAARKEMNKLLDEEEQRSAARVRVKERETTELLRVARQQVAENNALYLRDSANYTASVKAQEAAVTSAFDRIFQRRQRMQAMLSAIAAESATKAATTIPQAVDDRQQQVDDRAFQRRLDENYDSTERLLPLRSRLMELVKLASQLQATAKDDVQEQRAADLWDQVEAYRQQVVEAARIKGNSIDIHYAGRLQEEIDRGRIRALKDQAAMHDKLAVSAEQRVAEAEKHTVELEGLRAQIESQLDTVVKTAEGGYRQKTTVELKRDIAIAESTVAKFQTLLSKYSGEDFATAFLGDKKAFSEMRREATRLLASQDVKTLAVAPEGIAAAQADLQASFDKFVLRVPAMAVLMEFTGLDPKDVGTEAVFEEADSRLKAHDAAREQYVTGMAALRTATDAFGRSLAAAWAKLPATGDLAGVDQLLVRMNQAHNNTSLTVEEVNKLRETANKLTFTDVGKGGGNIAIGKIDAAVLSEHVLAILAALHQQAKAQEALRGASAKARESGVTAQQVTAVRSSLLELQKQRTVRDDILHRVSIEAQGNAVIKGQLDTNNTVLQQAIDKHGSILNAQAVEAQANEFLRTQLSQQTDELKSQYEWTQKVALLRAVMDAPTPSYSVAGKAFGGWLASGGYPRGLDTIPAMLSPGEFVVNARSARRFASQLIAMNAGSQPNYRNEGGSITNVGDIHVNVNGGGTSRQTAREIAAELKREIRRGTVRL